MAVQEGSRWASCSSKFADFDIPAPGANTGIISGGITFSPSAGVCRVTVALTTASVFNVTCTDGTTTHKWGLDESNALQAADLYTFVFGVRAKDASDNSLTYNFEVETDGVIEWLAVEEVTGGVI